MFFRLQVGDVYMFLRLQVGDVGMYVLKVTSWVMYALILLT